LGKENRWGSRPAARRCRRSDRQKLTTLEILRSQRGGTSGKERGKAKREEGQKSADGDWGKEKRGKKLNVNRRLKTMYGGSPRGRGGSGHRNGDDATQCHSGRGFAERGGVAMGQSDGQRIALMGGRKRHGEEKRTSFEEEKMRTKDILAELSLGQGMRKSFKKNYGSTTL